MQPKGENIHNAGKNNIADTFILSMLYHCMQKIHVQLCTFAVDMAIKSHTGVTKTNKTRKPAVSRKIGTYCTTRIIATENLTTGIVQVDTSRHA